MDVLVVPVYDSVMQLLRFPKKCRQMKSSYSEVDGRVLSLTGNSSSIFF